MTLIFCPNVYFNWARTFRFAKLRSLPLANMRGTRMREGQPKKEGRRSFVAYLPSLLGFPSRALSFLTLSPLAPRFIRVHVLRGLRDQESGGSGAKT